MQKMVGLKQIRKKKGYSQLKVAMDLNISREALSYYETGKRNPDLEMLIALSDYFRVSIDYLIRGKEFKYDNWHSLPWHQVVLVVKFSVFFYKGDAYVWF